MHFPTTSAPPSGDVLRFGSVRGLENHDHHLQNEHADDAYEGIQWHFYHHSILTPFPAKNSETGVMFTFILHPIVAQN